MKIYIAYGSNLNLAQMALRCPNAKPLYKGFVLNYKLQFNRVATIAPSEGDRVPVAVWIIDADSERCLDVYEGFPHLYSKEDVDVVLDSGKVITGMTYIMNGGSPSSPTKGYLDTIREGYGDVGLDIDYLERALSQCKA